MIDAIRDGAQSSGVGFDYLLATAQRSQPMSVAGELLWRLLPPLTVGTASVTIAAVLEPAYDMGGDAFDYSVDSREAQFAIFDSSGHDLSAGLTTSVALAAARTARREGVDLLGVAERIDAELVEQFDDFRFVTGVLARLDAEGCARYVVTDVNKDGMLQGPNLDLLRAVCAETDRPVVASGGITELADLEALTGLLADGVEGAIVGKALYAGAFTLPEALEAVAQA